MRLISTVRLGLALAACAGLAPAWAATPKAPAKAAPKAAAKPAAKAAPKPTAKPAAGKTPSQAVSNLISAMQVKDQDRIASAFDWQLLTKEMNKMLAGQQGLDAATYKKLFVEMLTVEPTVSKNLSVGKETMKGADRATVEMKRYFPAGSDNAKTGQTRTINTLSLAKTSKGWKIYRLDSAQQATVAAPMAPRAPQGMVPAAGADKK